MTFFDDLKTQKKENRNDAYRQYVTLQSDYTKTYGTEAGQRVLQQMIDRSGLFDSRIKDKRDIYWDAGAKDAFLQILAHVPLLAGQAIFNYCEGLHLLAEQEKIRMTKELDEV